MKMREKLSALLCCCLVGLCGSVVLADDPGVGALTIDCQSRAGNSVTGSERFVIDCSLTNKTGADIVMAGVQLKFPCPIPPQMGATGTIDSSFGAGGQGVFVDLANPTYIFPSGFAPVSQPRCDVAPTKGIGPPTTVAPGATFYVASMEYDVSNTATGSFDFDLVGYSHPPLDGDTTKARDDANALVALKVLFKKMEIATGTCCAGLTCLAGPVNQVDCEDKIGGTWNAAAQLCSDPSPCACQSNLDCDDSLTCTVDICTAGVCTHPPLDCDDGDACNIDDCAEPGGCFYVPLPAIDDGDECTIDECDPDTGDITHTPVDIDDGLDCTIDSCDPGTGVITHKDINGQPCPGGFGDCPQGAFECIDGLCTCSECSPVTISVKGGVKDNCYEVGDKVDIGINFPGSAPSSIIAGGSFRILYDPTCLAFQSASPSIEYGCETLADCPAGYTDCVLPPGGVDLICTGIDPWVDFIVDPEVDEVNGVIFLAVGVPIDLRHGKGSFLPGRMATILFNKLGKCDWCDVCFDDVNPYHTRLTTSKGDQIDLCDKHACSKDINANGDQELVCPGDAESNVDCDAVSTTVTWPNVVAADQCDGDLDVNCVCQHDPPHVCTTTGERCNYLEIALNQCGPMGQGVCTPKFDKIECDDLAWTGGLFAQGRYNFSCITKPDPGTQPCSQVETCDWTVTVSDRTTLDVTVQLSPNVINKEFSRCICFQLYTSCSPKMYETDCHTMNFGGAFDIAGHSTDSLKIPKGGNYECVTAADRQHSLRAKDNVVCDGVYTATFKGDPKLGGNWLIQGNLNRDDLIDILDFGVFIGQLNQNPTPGQDKTCEEGDGVGFTHADLNGDGVVDVADFTFIQINFLDHAKNPCCPDQATGSTGDVARTEVSVEEYPEYSDADLNGDGLINTADMGAYLEGARPAGKRIEDSFGSSGRTRR